MSDSRHRSPPLRGRDLPAREPGPETHSTGGPVLSTLSAARDQITRFIGYYTGPSEHEVEQLQIEVQRLRKLDSEWQDRTEELEREIKRMRRKLRDREYQREKLKNTTAELAIAQRFLSTADSLSQAEVVRAMEGLNEEIFQLTSIVADKVQIEEKKLPSSQLRANVMKRSPLLNGLGPFLEVIVPKQLQDTLAIQMGWQTILVTWCFNMIEAWVLEDPGHSDDEVNLVLRNMYEGTLSENDHAVAGRWRSIVHGITSDLSSQTLQSLGEEITQTLADLPVLCGYIFDDEGYQDIYNAFGQRIGPLHDKCLKFRRVVGEGVTSTDIRPCYFIPGDEYNPGICADLEYEDEKDEMQRPQQGIIACTLGLGLYCTRSPSDQDGNVGEDGESLLKPKIILQDTLKGIIE